MAIPFGWLIDDHGLTNTLVYYKGEMHLLTVAGAGSGKFRDQLAQTLFTLSARESIVCVDVKGQAAAVTWRGVADNASVLVLNPYDLWSELLPPACGFNPLASLDPGKLTFAADVRVIVDALIAVDNERERHWADSARSLIAGIIIFLVKYGPPEDRHLGEVRSIIAGPDANLAAFVNVAMRVNDRLVNERLARFANFGPDHREIQSVVATARTQTEFLSDDAIRASLARDDFRFVDFRQRLTTLYLVLPGELLDAQAKWLRLVIAVAIKDLMQNIEGGRVSLILDEFRALGHMQIIETMMALGRGYKLRIWPFLQDLGQLAAVYGPESAQTFLANVGVQQYFGVRDPYTAKEVAERAGRTTIIKPSASWREISEEEAGAGFTGVSWSYSQEDRPFLLPQDVLRMEGHEQILLMDGVPYIVQATRQPYWTFSGLSELALPDPYHDLKHARQIARARRPALSIGTRVNLPSSIPTVPRWK